MNENMAGSQSKQAGSKANRSIVFKLNSKMVLRLLGIFLSLDFFLLVAAAAAVIAQAENSSAEIAERLGSMPSYAEENNMWLRLRGRR